MGQKKVSIIVEGVLISNYMFLAKNGVTIREVSKFKGCGVFVESSCMFLIQSHTIHKHFLASYTTVRYFLCQMHSPNTLHAASYKSNFDISVDPSTE